mgnify:CR=1 FL=1
MLSKSHNIKYTNADKNNKLNPQLKTQNRLTITHLQIKTRKNQIQIVTHHIKISR